LNPLEFGRCTLGEVLTFIHAQNKFHESDNRHTAELIRWHGSLLVNMLGSGKKKTQPKDLFKFPDEVEDKPQRSPDDKKAKEIFEKMQKIIDKKKWQR
jgi:hypothetical protein